MSRYRWVRKSCVPRTVECMLALIEFAFTTIDKRNCNVFLVHCPHFDVFTGTNSSSFICQTRTTEASVMSTTIKTTETKTETDSSGMSEGANGDVDLCHLSYIKIYIS